MPSRLITPENPYGLSEKERHFALEYATNGRNATAAASSAGYKHPNKVGPENLVKVGIQAFLAEVIKPDPKDAEKVTTFLEREIMLTAIARGETLATFVTRDGTVLAPPDHMARLKALQFIGMMHGDFKPSQKAAISPGAQAMRESIAALRSMLPSTKG